MIDKDTVVCISIAEKPGNFGAVVFNTAFEELSMNYIYKPFKLDANNLKGAIDTIRAFDIRGCGVSMPHKVKVMRYLDKIDKTARKVGAVNTIVNNKGVLTGYNTDYEAAKILTKELCNVKGKDVIILGAGGAARSIVTALKVNGARNITVSSRDSAHGNKFANEFNINYAPWSKRADLTAGVLINATPVGMKKGDLSMFSNKSLAKADTVIDVVVSFVETDIIVKSKALKKRAIPGVKMASLHTMVAFKLYTGQNLPKKIVEKSMNKFLK